MYFNKETVGKGITKLTFKSYKSPWVPWKLGYPVYLHKLLPRKESTHSAMSHLSREIQMS